MTRAKRAPARRGRAPSLTRTGVGLGRRSARPAGPPHQAAQGPGIVQTCNLGLSRTVGSAGAHRLPVAAAGLASGSSPARAGIGVIMCSESPQPPPGCQRGRTSRCRRRLLVSTPAPHGASDSESDSDLGSPLQSPLRRGLNWPWKRGPSLRCPSHVPVGFTQLGGPGPGPLSVT